MSQENEKARKILIEKVLKNPNFTPEEIGALLTSMQTYGNPNTALTIREATVLKRNLPYNDENGTVTEVLSKLQPYLDATEKNYSDEPPTFASKLRGMRDWLTDLTTDNLAGFAGGTIIGTLGFGLLAGGIYGGYEMLINLPHIARPLVFVFGPGSLLLDGAGIATIACGISVIKDEIRKINS